MPLPCIQFSLNQPNIPWVDLQQQQNQVMQKQLYKKSCVRLITLLFKGTVGVILKDPWFIELDRKYLCLQPVSYFGNININFQEVAENKYLHLKTGLGSGFVGKFIGWIKGL